MSERGDKSGRRFLDKEIMSVPINTRDSEGLLLGCMDKRLVTIYPLLMDSHFGLPSGSFFKKTPAGSIGEVVFNKNNGRDHELSNIELALSTGIKLIVIVVHTDCAADGGASKFRNRDEELLFQWGKAEKGKDIILERFSGQYPDFRVELVLADIQNGQAVISKRVYMSVPHFDDAVETANSAAG